MYFRQMRELQRDVIPLQCNLAEDVAYLMSDNRSRWPTDLSKGFKQLEPVRF